MAFEFTTNNLNEFLNRLEGPEGCNFEEKDGGKDFTWDCTSKADYPHTKKVLKDMGATPDDIEAILAVADESGGYCDCEILFNAKDAILELAE